MAVDTETKRRSVAGMTIMALAIAPLADGTVVAADRQHILGLYAGIAAGAVAPGIQTEDLHIFSTIDTEPQHISDSGDNILVKGDVEIQGTVFAGGSNITGSEFNVTSVTSTYTIVSSDDLVFANGTFTITLPMGIGAGKTYTVKNTGAGTITLSSVNLIDGSVTASIPSLVAFRVSFDDITWWIA